jgi:ribosome-associated translation inhibitor RaiA
MQIQVHYQGLESSPWLEQFIAKKVAKLQRYLSPAASVRMNLQYNDGQYNTCLAIHSYRHDYAFTANGLNLYDSFSLAIEKASRTVSEDKRKLKKKIRLKSYFFS